MPVLLSAMAVLLAAVNAGANPPSWAVVRPLGSPGPVDYSPDRSGPLRQLNREFVTQNLGPGIPLLFNAASRPEPARPVLNTVAPANLVSTPPLRCVNGHQTEDPLSPPCVASFSGDNGGATYRGVSGDEIRILVVLSTSANVDLTEPERAGPGQLRAPYGTYYDLGAPPSADESQLPVMRGLRALQAYFNHRYQLYGRRLHIFAYNRFALPGDGWAHNNALENDILVRPFAALVGGDDAATPAPSEYPLTFAERGVPAFDLYGFLTEQQAQRYPGFLWSYPPGVEDAAALYSSYICQKVVGLPVALSGNPGENGKARRLGLLVPAGPPSDPAGNATRAMAELVKDRVRSCGGKLEVVEHQEPTGCGNSEDVTDWVHVASDLRSHEVTTVLAVGCLDVAFAGATTALGYFPEWILWGAAGNANDPVTSTAFNHHAIDISPEAFVPAPPDRICFRAQTAEDPGIPPYSPADDACDVYEGLRQIVSAVQLAGPFLTPKSLDAGVRNAPAQTSSGPQTPLCRYAPGDYTCVKDAQAEIWSYPPFGNYVDWPIAAPLPVSGCWLGIEGGRRYRAGQWPPGNVDAQLTGHEPCEQYGTRRFPY